MFDALCSACCFSPNGPVYVHRTRLCMQWVLSAIATFQVEKKVLVLRGSKLPFAVGHLVQLPPTMHLLIFT